MTSNVQPQQTAADLTAVEYADRLREFEAWFSTNSSGKTELALTDTNREAFQTAAVATLLVRERLEVELSKTQLAPALLEGTLRVDKRLRELAKVVPSAEWKDIQKGWPPPEKSKANWWWSLEGLTREEPSPVWLILTVLLGAVSVALATDVCKRFFVGGFDPIGIFSLISQSVLAVIAGSAFTQAGSNWVRRWLSRTEQSETLHPRIQLGIVAFFFAVVLTVELALPWIAQFYMSRGLANRSQNLFSAAEHKYRLAAALDPTLSDAHYRLGEVLDANYSYDDAIASYKTAIALDSNNVEARNNLGHLYITFKKDYAGAVEQLFSAYTRINDPNVAPSISDAIRYSICKNLGWAHLELKNYKQAQLQLDDAVDVAGDGGAEAHALLGKLVEAEGELAKQGAPNGKTSTRDYAKEVTDECQRALGCVKRGEYMHPELLSWVLARV